MLTPLKIVIDVDPFIRAQVPHSVDAARLCAAPSRLDDRVNYQQSNVPDAPRRTAPFPNGDPSSGAKASQSGVRAQSLPTRVALVIRWSLKAR
jgi:hypothetical protein